MVESVYLVVLREICAASSHVRRTEPCAEAAAAAEAEGGTCSQTSPSRQLLRHGNVYDTCVLLFLMLV